MSRPPYRLIASAVLVVGAALACGSDVASYRSKSLPGPTLNTEALHHAFVAPPDRALVGVRLTLTADSFEGSGAALREELRVLEAGLSDATGCAMRILDYRHPEGGAWTGSRWTTTAEVVVDVDLTGLDSVAGRMDRLDGCARVVSDRLANDEEIDGVRRTVTAAPAVITVDDPGRHLPALVAREVARLTAAHAVTGAPQLHPEDLRCVPTGEVTVGQRLLSGVELATAVNCRIASVPPAQG